MTKIDQKEDRVEFEASGVEQLIGRLREEGVESGEARAAEVLAEAEERAREVVKDARREAAEIIAHANAEARQTKEAGVEALRMAARDAAVRLQERLMERLRIMTERLVSAQLADTELLKGLIVEVARSVRDNAKIQDAEELEIGVPALILGDTDRMSPEETERHLTEFAKQIMARTLREGVRITDLGKEVGIEFRLDNGDVTVDLTEGAIASVLFQHLQPRFRTLMMELSQD